MIWKPKRFSRKKNLDKVPEAAKELDKPICDEVLEIYADIRSLGLERVW
ncbi:MULTISPECIES: hypothetical protein [Anaerotruncus]|nr:MULTISPECIES: hypothetical protein [Anaerotruncus]